jgi:hypothetical protein
MADSAPCLQGQSAEHISGAKEGPERDAAERLPALYCALLALLQAGCTQPAEQLCRALTKADVPAWLRQCLSHWPASLAAQLDLV